MACRNNLQGCIFLKEINQTACAFPSCVYFLQKNIFSKQAFQRFYRSIFFAAQPWQADLYKIFEYILHFGSGIFTIYLKRKQLKNLYISVCTIIRFSQNLQKKIKNCKQEQYIINVLANQMVCLNCDCHKYFEFSRLKNQINLFYQSRMPFLYILDASMVVIVLVFYMENDYNLGCCRIYQEGATCNQDHYPSLGKNIFILFLSVFFCV